MFRILGLVAMLGVFAAYTGAVRADAAKEVKLTGTLTCAHCQLKEGSSCQTVLQVKNGDKTDTYYLAANDVAKGVHHSVCKGGKDNVSVTGTVDEKDGKKWITASKIEGLEAKG